MIEKEKEKKENENENENEKDPRTFCLIFLKSSKVKKGIE